MTKTLPPYLWKAVVSLLLAGGMVAPSVEAAPRQPNVILVMTDDQGYGDVHAHGNTMIRTPHLDRLHAESVRLTNYHVDPTCSPTRSALLTGRYSTRTGVWHTIMGRSLMYRDEITVADVFSANGYRTAMFGKWHLGDNYPMRPQDRGFQETLAIGGGGVTQTPDYWGNTYFDDTYYHNGKPEKFKGYCTDVFFDNALKFIEQNKAKRFFVYLPTNVPHGPYNVAEKYSKPYLDRGVPQPMANFYGMIENLDENMGRLLASLKQWGLEQDTVLIWTTDNGTAAGVSRPGGKSGKSGKGKNAPTGAQWTGFNAGMRAQKGSEYDGGHRVPLFIRWPAGGLGGGRDVTQLTAHLDMLPTLADLCGLKFTPRNPLDGRSLVPLLTGGARDWPARTLFVHTQREEIPPKWTRSAAMTERWRLVNGKELYDMPADPGQTQDVSAQHAGVVAKLKEDYEQWWASLQPAFTNYGYIVIGAEQENPALITCMDWHAELVKDIPWNQEQIKSASWANGYWMIDVARAGRYEFTLRQQPAVAKFPLEASQARVRVGQAEATGAVPKGADGVKLTLKLAAGPSKLATWLTDESSGKSRGAFFVEVRRVGE